MKSILTKILILIAILAFSSSVKAQSVDELKKQKLEEKKEKLKQAKQTNTARTMVLGYHGGTMAPIGANMIMLLSKKVGFYASFRSAGDGFEEKVGRDYKTTVLNAGVSKNIFFPVAIYTAAGIAGYNTVTPSDYPYPDDMFDADYEFGVDTSAGIIIHVKSFKVQGGVSLFNLSRPELTFGLGINIFHFN